MPYHFLPNIIAIIAILGIIIMILRHLPEAASKTQTAEQAQPVEHRLLTKGLPAIAVSKIKSLAKFWAGKIWIFILEAKDLKPTALAGYKIKKIFRHANKSIQTGREQFKAQTVKDEKHFLELIKKDPKNHSNYDLLGRFYLEKNNISDARDIYEYLASHESSNADYHARLAYCHYQFKNFDKASDSYQKSVTLDSSQPNRYYNLGLCLEVQSKFMPAAEAVNKAIALEPLNAKYHISLGNIYSAMGKSQEARSAWLQAKELDPINKTIDQKLDKLGTE